MPLDSDDILRLYDRESEKLLRYLMRRTLDAQVALDLLAESYAVAFEKRRRFKGQSEDAVAWLFGIAKNLVADYFRKGSTEQRAMRRLGVTGVEVGDEEIARIERLAETGELRAAVAEAIASLNADQSAALQLRIVEELSYPEVAARMNVSEQVARARVSRGLKNLRDMIAPVEEAFDHV